MFAIIDYITPLRCYVESATLRALAAAIIREERRLLLDDAIDIIDAAIVIMAARAR